LGGGGIGADTVGLGRLLGSDEKVQWLLIVRKKSTRAKGVGM